MCPDCDMTTRLDWSTGQAVCPDCGQVVQIDSDMSKIIRTDYSENLYTVENYIGSWAEVIHKEDMVARFEHRNAYQAAKEYAQGILTGYYK
jgi:predicted amidophosphoribosyltransferase